jgi:hypothetical protein
MSKTRTLKRVSSATSGPSPMRGRRPHLQASGHSPFLGQRASPLTRPPGVAAGTCQDGKELRRVIRPIRLPPPISTKPRPHGSARLTSIPFKRRFEVQHSSPRQRARALRNHDRIHPSPPSTRLPGAGSSVGYVHAIGGAGSIWDTSARPACTETRSRITAVLGDRRLNHVTRLGPIA